MSPGDPTDPTEFAEPANAAKANSESTLVAVSRDGDADTDDASSSGGEKRIPGVGTKIGKYELKEKLGTGGMSIVFKAHDLTLDRFVALKLLLPQRGSDSIDIMRFQQEAKAASRLEHPNIVKVHDFNITDDGMPYLVMSYLEGVSLAAEIKKEGGLQVGRWLAIMVQACDALTHAHENNVVHRDIKPSNFVLCQEKGTEVLKLVDFGIAKIETNDDQALTKTGEVFGSPMYMSPEQCSGSKVDSRSDVYSLGCVMYEGLAGRPPLAGENSLATIVKHLQETPESLTSVCRNLKNIESIDKIVMKCLEKKPDDRYPDTLSVRKELEKIFLGQKVKRKPLDRRTMTALVSAVVLLFAAVIGYKYYSDIEHEKQAKAAAILRQKQKDLGRSLRWIARDHLKKGKIDEARSDLLRAIEASTAAQDSPIYMAMLTVDLGDCETIAHNLAVAKTLYQKVADWPLPIDSKFAIEAKFDAYNHLGYDAKYNQLKSREAYDYYLKALDFAQLIKRPKPRKLVLLELSKISEEEGRTEDAKKYLEQAQSILGDDEEVVHSMTEFYARQKNYAKQKEVRDTAYRIHAEKEKKRKEKREKQKREAAIEKESDRQSDLKAAKLKKEWGEAILPTTKE